MMRLHTLTILSLALLMLPPATALAQPSPGRAELAENAALQYWQAFSQMPTLDKDQERLVAEWKTVAINDPAVKKLLASSEGSMLYLRRAAKLRQCNWGLDYKDGLSLLLPQLAKGRDLARLAALHTRQALESENRQAALADATAILTLARHIGSEPIIICVAVRYAIEGMAIDLLAPYLPEWKASSVEAAAMLDSLPPAPDLLPTIATEKKYFVAWTLNKMKEEEQRKPGSGLALWKNLLSGSEVPEEIKQIASVERAAKLLEDVLPLCDDLERVVALPKPQFDAQFPGFKEKAKAVNPLAAITLPAVEKIMAKQCFNQASFAMLKAAIAIVEGGEAKLKEIKDPFGTGPFEYRALDKGFELKSKLLYEGQPVTLVVGQRK